MSVALPKGNVAHYVNAISAAAIYIALPRLGASQHATSCAGAAKVPVWLFFLDQILPRPWIEAPRLPPPPDRSSKYS